MKRLKKSAAAIIAICAMITMILDTKTALKGASLGLELCIRSIIPSLFPFIFLSGIINKYLLENRFSLLYPIGRLCKIPKGSESILLLGLLAGYPVGAKILGQAYQQGQLSKLSASRMLGFCNNAGPAFIFGILSAVFHDRIAPWVLWGIHVVSAIAVGCILPGHNDDVCQINENNQQPIQNHLQNSIKSMSLICCWIIIFRIIINYLETWFLWKSSIELQVVIYGLLELSNGCIMLNRISDEGIRFILTNLILAFGGLCVAMQTYSVKGELSYSKYLPGKIMQTILSLLLSLLLQPILFPDTHIDLLFSFLLIIICVISIIPIVIKKIVAIKRRM